MHVLATDPEKRSQTAREMIYIYGGKCMGVDENSLWKSYPYQAGDGREDSSSRNARDLRGGSFDSFDGYARCAYRSTYNPSVRDRDLGFRVCASSISIL